MTTDIPPPSVPLTDPSRSLFCQMAIESLVHDTVDAAVQAGWNESEVLAAVIDIADNLMLVSGSNAEVDRLLKSIRRNRD